MQSFHELSLPSALSASLAAMNYVTPTPIQAQAIPHALEGRDVLGSAQTGTGKTAAFGIPLVAALMQNPTMTALVMTPTRELAVQVQAMLKQLSGDDRSMKTVLLIGGEPMPKQLSALKAKPWPRIIVGTPGRINDHLGRGSLKLRETGFVVLDETDRMLDMGFGVQIDRVLEHVSDDRQTLLFSATMPANINKMAARYTRDAVRVAAGEANASATNIEQVQVHLQDSEKYARLTSELDSREGSVLIFVKTKWNARKMAERLDSQGYEADAIHGDLRQNKRDKVIASFRAQKIRILVATDVAARGLDIPHIEHVVNYDLPQAAEDYIHRIGRTARAGASGHALNFVSPADSGKWRVISRLLSSNELPEEDAGRGPRRKGGDSGYGRSNGGGAERSSQTRSFGKASFGKPRREAAPREARVDSEPAREERRDRKPKPFNAERMPGESRGFKPSFGKGKKDFAPREDRGGERKSSRPFGGERSRSDEPRNFDRPKRDFAPREDRGGERSRSDAAPQRRDGKSFGKPFGKPSFGKPKKDYAASEERGGERKSSRPFNGERGRSDEPRNLDRPKRDFAPREDRSGERTSSRPFNGERNRSDAAPQRREGKSFGKPFGKKPEGKSFGQSSDKPAGKSFGKPAGKRFGKPAGAKGFGPKGASAPFRGKARPQRASAR